METTKNPEFQVAVAAWENLRMLEIQRITRAMWSRTKQGNIQLTIHGHGLIVFATGDRFGWGIDGAFTPLRFDTEKEAIHSVAKKCYETVFPRPMLREINQMLDSHTPQRRGKLCRLNINQPFAKNLY